MKQKITIYTIAEELHMTPSMVSRAFNPNARIDPSKRELVLKTAKKYNYKPNAFASRLSRNNIKIGILGKSAFRPLTNQLLNGITKSYEELKDYKIEISEIITDSFEECKKQIKSLYDCDGVIVFGLSSDIYLPLLNKLKENVKNVVQLQSVNEKFESIFNSKHNEKVASEMAAEFLYNCLKLSPTKNIVLFTGNASSYVHKTAGDNFIKKCTEYGLNILESVDMKNDGSILKKSVENLYKKHKKIDGIYITSGNSVELCKFLEAVDCKPFLVTFDLYDDLVKYINNGTVNATIYQNLEKQGQNAFEHLVNHLVKGEQHQQKNIYTNVTLVFKSNLSFFI